MNLENLQDQHHLLKAPVLVTGAAGFIGHFVCKALLAMGARVVGVDNLNDYYDPALKKARLAALPVTEQFSFEQLDIADQAAMAKLFDNLRPAGVIHLAAQAGVRYSLKHPHAYAQANLTGFLNILEGCRHNPNLKHLVYASSSSVYGLNVAQPFSETDPVVHPASLYAATKKANEMMAHSYAHSYGLPTTGLRFFTVYGPWGRPDMAIFIFTKALLEGQPITLFENGDLLRDFTYIDDIVEGVVRIFLHPACAMPDWQTKGQPAHASSAPYRLYNIGNHNPVRVRDMVTMLEDITNRQTDIISAPMQVGDVFSTCADVKNLQDVVGFAPDTDLKKGLIEFVNWYQDYHGKTDTHHDRKAIHT